MEEAYRGQRWYQENKDKCLEANRRYIKKNESWIKKFRRELRQEVINAYGGKCVCCNEHRWQFLTLDHPNGGGEEDRAKHRMITGQIYAWAKKNGYPAIYRVLCMNCNWVRRYNGICPHDTERAG